MVENRKVNKGRKTKSSSRDTSNSSDVRISNGDEPQDSKPPPSGQSNKNVQLAKIALLLMTQLPLYSSYPIMHALGYRRHHSVDDDDVSTSSLIDTSDPNFWTNMGISVFLVLLGGVFAGLTLGLMGQDEVYLQVMEQSGEESERKSATRVLSLLKRGKHWVLVTLLLSNVITNETLPIVLDRCLGGGWPAVVSSTVAIVIFGEIIPQSLCVRYGLSIGAVCAPFVLGLMYVMYPVAYPVSMLLDYALGEDHGTVYKKAGLKTLVTLHKNMGVERLNEDEVTIISAVLDLKEKPVGSIMTPMEDVFVMSSDRILDEQTIEEILHTGFNRIPIHAPGEPENFIGMLLVRILITYDPEDALPISSFPLATLPETGPDTSCLNILNYFQEGKSHMVIVSENPGGPSGTLGVLTLEDVIEELIGEEIIDESDVYVDVHKAIRRTQPPPISKRSGVVNNTTTGSYYHHHQSPKGTTGHTFGVDPVFAALAEHTSHTNTPVNGHSVGDNSLPKIKLGPSNKASNPRLTGNRNVHIKTAQLDRQREQDILRNGTINGQGSDKPQNQPNVNHPVADSNVSASNIDGVPISVHGSETSAVRDAIKPMNNNSNHNFNNGNLTAIIPNRNARGSVSDSDLPNGANAQPAGEVHSYRTGGFIESVVDHQGIKKTVIEDVSDEESGNGTSNNSGHNSSSNSTHSDDENSNNLIKSTQKRFRKHRHKKQNDEETNPLLFKGKKINDYASTSP